MYTNKTAERDSHLHTCKLTQTTGVIVSQLKVNRSRPVNKYIFILLLANAFDIETNPGPRAPKWPCGTCKQAVKWNPKRPSICGDNCETILIVNTYTQAYPDTWMQAICHGNA